MNLRPTFKSLVVHIKFKVQFLAAVGGENWTMGKIQLNSAAAIFWA